MVSDKRKTTQYIMPYRKSNQMTLGYNIYPVLSLAEELISIDMNQLAKRLSIQKTVIIDGYTGVFFGSFRERLNQELLLLGIDAHWICIDTALREEEEINRLIAPFMGEDDSIFGRRATIDLKDYFDDEKLISLRPEINASINIIYGTGAQFAGWNGLFLYIDLPKNELQFRARARSVKNLGACQSYDIKDMYKRYYFVDWVVLNKHKKEVLEKIDIFIDGQQDEVFPWIEASELKKGLQTLSLNFFRVRPWFEPGVWGGTWIKNHIQGINADAQNYAWSFELITPENGIIFESSGYLLEVSFDFLMLGEGKSILGKDYETYGYEFPLRFDFLDTFDGDNLSIQCHPTKEYCMKNFGENITQEETYYILDKKNKACVYLGFQENIDPPEFEQALRNSANEVKELNITGFVQKHKIHKHDLFLIPPGTIHGSGTDTLVLEISTTPYIFTFKLYDWVRPDLNGRPRPLNIDHGIKNLFFDRKGKKVREELISRPILLKQGDNWMLYELPTHKKHSYRVKRYHFLNEIKVETYEKFHVLSLVEGDSITVTSERGLQNTFNYAETFVVSAAAKSYTIKNNSEKEAIVVVAFMK